MLTKTSPDFSSGRRFFYLNFFLSSLMFWVSPAWAEEVNCPSRFALGAINLSFENDLFGFLRTDRHYTNGLRLSLVSKEINNKDSNANSSPTTPTKSQDRSNPNSAGTNPCDAKIAKPAEAEGLTDNLQGAGHKFAKFIVDKIPDIFHKFDTDDRISFNLGQNIYTPENIGRRDLIANDRPYAGWFYIGFGLLDIRDESVFDSLEFDMGVVGPYSLAREAQTKIHELRDFVIPAGWDNQLKNEPGLFLAYQRKWRLARADKGKFDFDFMPHAGGAVGNIYTYLNGGATLRLGYNIPDDYGPPSIRPGIQGSDFFKNDSGVGAYVFASTEGRAMGRNIFLDGNTFTDSHNVEKIPLVGDLQFGLAVFPCKGLRITVANVFRSREFYEQKSMDNYGVLNATYSFE